MSVFLVSGAVWTMGAMGCGPFIEPMRLSFPRAVLEVPLTTFWDGLEDVDGGRVPVAFDSRDGNEEAVGAMAREEIGAAVEAAGGDAAAVLAGVERVRKAVGRGLWPLRWKRDEKFKIEHKRPIDVAAVLADPVFGQLPGEFAMYLRGVVLYRAGRFDEAVASWRWVLALPEAERQHRGVMSAWMVAREAENLEAAVPLLERVIEEVRLVGFDGLHLEAAATGLLARAAHERGDRVEAAKLYYAQHRAGDASGSLSLWQTLPVRGEVLPEDEVVSLAEDPLVRRLVTARLGAAYGRVDRYPGYVERADGFEVQWLEVLEREAGEVGGEAVKRAWLAYGMGRFDEAQRWLALAGDDGGEVAVWLEAKLWLVKGDVLTASERLAAVLEPKRRAWDEARVHVGEWDSAAWEGTDVIGRQRWSQLFSDAGILAVATAEMEDALWLFLQSGYWKDAAYVAERLMETEELMAFVDERFPEVAERPLKGLDVDDQVNALLVGWWRGHGESANPARELRSLLARRLVREGKLDQAAPYFPVGLREICAHLAGLLDEGRSEVVLEERRAAALWEAAQTVRAFGMELQGTELVPDAYVYGGSFEASRIDRVRSGGEVESWERWTEDPVPAVGAVERLMLERVGVPERRFHYRWEAAELAWEAAELMPGDREETARVLHIAGSWIRLADPPGADRFYKAMIWRNWETPLARETDVRRWFLYESGWSKREFRRELVGRLLKG